MIDFLKCGISQPVWTDGKRSLIKGDALSVLAKIPDRSFAKCVTDPPYSSGGTTVTARMRDTQSKYDVCGRKLYPKFDGDNRDQRSMLFWLTLLITQLYRILDDNAAMFLFSDWRMLPTFSDAVQAGGFTWRGIIPWDKTNAARPQKGWFRSQCEYVITATKGPIGTERDRIGETLDGIWVQNVQSEIKWHQTQKPVGLYRYLYRALGGRGPVIDPFAGSGTALIAAAENGLEAVAIESNDDVCAAAVNRLNAENILLSGIA